MYPCIIRDLSTIFHFIHHSLYIIHHPWSSSTILTTHHHTLHTLPYPPHPPPSPSSPAPILLSYGEPLRCCSNQYHRARNRPPRPTGANAPEINRQVSFTPQESNGCVTFSVTSDDDEKTYQSVTRGGERGRERFWQDRKRKYNILEILRYA